MSNEIALIDPNIAEEKRIAWGQMGVVVYQSELQLQAQAQAIINTITYPTSIEEIPGAEAKLKEVKASQKTIEGKRKEITSRFDDVTSRLMAAEKSFADPIKKLSDSIISEKQKYEQIQKKKQAIALEAANINQHYTNEFNRIKAELASKVNTFVSRCYEKALKDNVEPDIIEAYLNASKGAVKAEHFSFVVTPFAVVYDENKELSEQLITSTKAIDINLCVKSFESEVDKKFSDYEIAFNNKAEALRQSQQAEEENNKRIEEQKNASDLAAKLQATSSPVSTATVFTKDLKKIYEVDMPETVESVLSIMAAFAANITLCLPKLKVNKWFAFTPAQAANVLGKLKSDDNNFQPTGITFKEVSKL